MEVLHDVVKAGKARYLGASSMYAWQFAKAQHVAATRFVSMQNHYNLIYREEEREMIPRLDHAGLPPWSPPARGLLAGSVTTGGERRTTRARTDPFLDSLYRPDLDLAVIDRAGEVAAERASPPPRSRSLAPAQARGHRADRGRDLVEYLEDALAAEQLPLSEEGDRPARGAVRARPRPGSSSNRPGRPRPPSRPASGGSSSSATTTMVEAGRVVANTAPWAWPTASSRPGRPGTSGCGPRARARPRPRPGRP